MISASSNCSSVAYRSENCGCSHEPPGLRHKPSLHRDARYSRIDALALNECHATGSVNLSTVDKSKPSHVFSAPSAPLPHRCAQTATPRSTYSQKRDRRGKRSSLNVRFHPKATELLRRREMTQRARSRHRCLALRYGDFGGCSNQHKSQYGLNCPDRSEANRHCSERGPDQRTRRHSRDDAFRA